MAVKRQILACTGGFQNVDNKLVMGPIVEYGLKLTGKKKPKLCWLGTAGGDSERFLDLYYEAVEGKPLIASHLALFTKPNVKDVREFLLSQDIIWVMGGSVANLLAVWKVHGLDKIMKEAWDKGIILAGTSAGSICWHVGGTTDSFGDNLRPINNGLGLLPYSNGVHYDSEEQRRPLFQNLIKTGVIPEGYATDEGVGLHFIDYDLNKAVSDREGQYAYKVSLANNEVKETRIKPELIK